MESRSEFIVGIFNFSEEGKAGGGGNSSDHRNS